MMLCASVCISEARAIGARVGFAPQGGEGEPADAVTVWSLYIPNGRELEHPHYAYKLAWLEALRSAGAEWLTADDAAESRTDHVLVGAVAGHALLEHRLTRLGVLSRGSADRQRSGGSGDAENCEKFFDHVSLLKNPSWRQATPGLVGHDKQSHPNPF